VFEDKVLSRIFGPKREEGTGGWRESCIMRSFIDSNLIIKVIKLKMRWARHIPHMGD
jgi:hypothetical protein